MRGKTTGVARPTTDATLSATSNTRSNAAEDRHFVTALARGLDVLSCFRDASKLLGNQEIAERCHLPKSTVSRLTYTLTRLGYLDLIKDVGKYRLGTASAALGASALSKFDARLVAAPLMRELADFSRASISLGVRERLNIVYIENARGDSTFTLNVDAGWRVPIATTSIGRAYLAACSYSERAFLMDSIREENEATWPNLRQQIEASIAQYNDIGCCCSFGDWHPEVNAIAVAFNRGQDQPPMALNCGGPKFSLKPEFLLEEVRPRMIAVAKQIERSVQAASY
ncbi:IclR family transcriptional regulator [Imbroritus primus]|uniref:IclR family transcriptional regulator n=1 Tax=Imbroritus primus TaxID=3058603 RepID=A0ACD3SSJ4_9BURK|nr:IclR family transcriptional regulator [Burkholderiaceae bacterium PBA]